MWLKKDKGGSAILWHGTEYSWPEDGYVIEVPDNLAADLLAIPGGGYSRAEAPQPALKDEPKDEPAKEPPKAAPPAKA